MLTEEKWLLLLCFARSGELTVLAPGLMPLTRTNVQIPATAEATATCLKSDFLRLISSAIVW